MLEFVQLGPEFGFLGLEFLKCLGAVLRFLPGFDVYLKIGGELVVDAQFTGLEANEKRCVPLRFLCSEKE